MTGSSWPDQRVDVLEEDDPGRDLVRPVDLLRLLLVLAEVAGGVEELLRDDRRPQLAALERHALAGLGGAAALEPLAHRRHVEDDDLVALDAADPALVERHEPSHRDHLLGVPVRREDRVEDLRHTPVSKTSVSRLYSGRRLELERRQAERVAELRLGSEITG
jgi:hypothetical protein